MKRYDLKKSNLMKVIRIATLIFAFFISFLPKSSAVENDSLLKYIEIAIRNNPGVMQKFTQYQAALQKIPQAGSLSDPQLDIGVFLSPMELMSGYQVAEMKLMQMFPWFGVLRNAKDEMSQMANASFEQFRDAKLQVSYDVQKAWNDLYRIRYDIRISEKNLDILKIIERLALIRYKTAPAGNQGGTSSGQAIIPGASQNRSSGGSSAMQGMTGSQGGGNIQSAQQSSQMQSGSMESTSGTADLSGIYRIQIESGDLRNNIALLQSEEKTAMALFNSYLNRPPEMPVITGDTLVTANIDRALASGQDSINANNPMLKMIDYERQSYEARKKMVTGMGYPMVGVGVNYSLINRSEMSTSEMNGKDMVMPMVSVTLPVYRKKYKAMKKEADLLGAAASQNYQATANSLHTEYFRSVQLYQDAQRRAKLYDEQYQLASKTFEIMLKSFSATSTDLTDVLRVRQQMLDYEINKVQALTDLNTAVAGLRRIMASTAIN